MSNTSSILWCDNIGATYLNVNFYRYKNKNSLYNIYIFFFLFSGEAKFILSTIYLISVPIDNILESSFTKKFQNQQWSSYLVQLQHTQSLHTLSHSAITKLVIPNDNSSLINSEHLGVSISAAVLLNSYPYQPLQLDESPGTISVILQFATQPQLVVPLNLKKLVYCVASLPCIPKP